MRAAAQRLLACAIATGAITIGVGLAQQDSAAGGLRRARLYEVASCKTLNNVNRNDAQAALKVWAELMGQQKGFLLDSKVDIVDTVGELIARLESHSVDALVICVTEFLELEARHLAVPVFTNGRHGQALYSYVVVVNRSSTATGIAGLRGKNVLVSSRTSENAGVAWIDVLLSKERLGRASSFFASMKATDKAQGCILPVFFGTVDACVVDEVNLNLAKEMNPQLGQLKVLVRSRPMIEDLVAIPVEPHPYTKEWIEAMLTAQQDPRGRQILLVFKTDKVVLIQPGDLDAARELWRDYFRLPGSTPNKTPLAPGKGGQMPTQ
jgi:ABC-type phosphate/phosphonate transport system substrate-binding protein